MGGDLNDTLLKGKNHDDYQSEHIAARLMHKLHSDFQLAAVNIEREAGPTYFGENHESEIDMVSVPQELLPKVSDCRVLQRAGRTLQMASVKRPHDHWPLQVTFRYALHFTTAKESDRVVYDRDLLAAEVTRGKHRHKFLEALATAGEGDWLEEHEQATTAQGPWRTLVEDIRKAVEPIATRTQKQRHPVYSKLRQRRV